jgi:hypothetical protein
MIPYRKKLLISTNNIARGMVRGGRKYASNSPKICFHPNTKLSTNTTDKSEKRLDKKEKHLNK